MPSELRHDTNAPPLKMMRRAWSISTSRALWGGTAWSGSGFHYHSMLTARGSSPSPGPEPSVCPAVPILPMLFFQLVPLLTSRPRSNPRARTDSAYNVLFFGTKQWMITPYPRRGSNPGLAACFERI